MVNIAYDSGCTFRPHDLGICLAKLIADRKIADTSKFVFYTNEIGKDKDGNSYEKALVFLLDDFTDEEKNLMSVS